MDSIEIRSGRIQVDFPKHTYTNGQYSNEIVGNNPTVTIDNVKFANRTWVQNWANVMIGEGVVRFARSMPDNNYAVAFCTSGIHNAYMMTVVVTQYRNDSFSYAWAINVIQPNARNPTVEPPNTGQIGPTPFRPMYRPLIHWVAVSANDNQPYIRMINPNHHPQQNVILSEWYKAGGGVNGDIDKTTRVNFMERKYRLTNPFPDGNYAVFGSVEFAEHGYGLMLTSWGVPDTNDPSQVFIYVYGIDNYMVNGDQNTGWVNNSAIGYTDQAIPWGQVGSFNINYTGFAVHESISSHPELSKFIQLVNRKSEVAPINSGTRLALNRDFVIQRGSSCIFTATTLERAPAAGGTSTGCSYAPTNNSNRTMFIPPTDMYQPLNNFATINSGLTMLPDIRYWIYIDERSDQYRVYYYPTGANNSGVSSATATGTGGPIIMYTLTVSNMAWMFNWKPRPSQSTSPTTS